MPHTDDAEVPLSGGNMNAGVVRVGDTVRRATTPATPAIHRLLAHMRDAGLEWVPRVHGIDEHGREVLDFIDGEVAHGEPAWLRDPKVLTDVATALGQWHRASLTFERREADRWWWPGKAPAEVICHVDFAPYNHVFRDGNFVGAIDFDLCYPAPRLWDVGYTAYRYVPLTPGVDDAVPDGAGADRTTMEPVEQRRRLNEFLDAYAMTAGVRPTVPETMGFVVVRLDAMADWCEQQTNDALQANGVMYRAHARWLEAGALSDVEPALITDLEPPGKTA